MKIARVTKDLYVFETKDGTPMALEIFAQDEWMLYETWYVKLWVAIKDFIKWVFHYHQPPKNKLVHIGRVKKRLGLRLFRYNKRTGELSALPEGMDSVMVEPDCIYRQALNKKNFVKRLKREGIMQ